MSERMDKIRASGCWRTFTAKFLLRGEMGAETNVSVRVRATDEDMGRTTARSCVVKIYEGWKDYELTEIKES